MTPDRWLDMWAVDKTARELWSTLTLDQKEKVKQQGNFGIRRNRSSKEISAMLMGRMKVAVGSRWIAGPSQLRQYVEASTASGSSAAPDANSVLLRRPLAKLQPWFGWQLKLDSPSPEESMPTITAIVQVNPGTESLKKAGWAYALNALWSQLKPQRDNGRVCEYQVFQQHFDAGYGTSAAHQNVYMTFFRQPTDVLAVENRGFAVEALKPEFSKRKPHELTDMCMRENRGGWNLEKVAVCRQLVAQYVQFQPAWTQRVEEVACKVFGPSGNDVIWWAVHIRLSDKVLKEAPSNKLSVADAGEVILTHSRNHDFHNVFIACDNSEFKNSLVTFLQDI